MGDRRVRKRSWGGWVDAMEEVLRVLGSSLAAVESVLDEDHGRARWSRPEREDADLEVARRVLDVPVLGRLVAAAARVGRDGIEPPRDPRWLSPWGGEDHLVRRLEDRVEPLPEPPPGTPPPGPGEEAPARLRVAERALAARTRSLAVLLEDLVNPLNVSAVVRTAEALGLAEIHVVHRQGRVRLARRIHNLADRWLDIHLWRDVEDAVSHLRERGFRLLVADFGPGSIPVDEVSPGGPVALAFGSEQEGVSPRLAALADGFFHVPTRGMTAYLNVSVTAAIALHVVDGRLAAAGLREPLPEREVARLRRAWYAILAGNRPGRREEYLRWLLAPPPPAPPVREVPSREKAARRKSPPGPPRR